MIVVVIRLRMCELYCVMLLVFRLIVLRFLSVVIGSVICSRLMVFC